MEFSINSLWIYLFLVSIINFRTFVTQKNFKHFNIKAVDSSMQDKKQNISKIILQYKKCFAICSNDATSTIVVQIATDNVTKINIPVIDDIMAIVYYKCTEQVTQNGLGKYEYHTFQTLCGNRTEKCKKFNTSFDKQWVSLKTGEKPILSVSFTLPDDSKNIKIKIQNCAQEQIIFPFKVKNESIDYREQHQSYTYLKNIFTSQNLEQMPITLSITIYQVEVLADVSFNVTKVKLEKCSKVNGNYCENLCSNNKMVVGTKCKLKIKNKEVVIENKNITCPNKEQLQKLIENQVINMNQNEKLVEFYGGICEYYKFKNIPPCESICINLPNCNYMCVERKADLVEVGYHENVIKYHSGLIGSGGWSFESIPNELVYVNECKFSSTLCKGNSSCIDEPVGYKCANDSYDIHECRRLKKSRFWHCPKIPNSTLPETSESIFEKTDQVLMDIQNTVKELSNTKTKINKLMKSAYKFSNEIKISYKKIDSRQKKNVSSIVITQIEKSILQILNMGLNASQTYVNESTDEYDTYSSYVNETEDEHVIPISENKSVSEKQFVKLKIKESTTIPIKEKLITTFIRFKDMDIMDESSEIEFKIKNSTSLKFKDEDMVERYKNSDFISLSLNQNRNVTVHFKLQTFQRIDSPSWLYSFEDECGYLDEDKPWEWSIDGCRKVKIPDNQYYCECDHLSNFAMLFSIKTVNTIHLNVFKYLSLLGGIINIISLIFFLTFVLFINSRDKLRLDQLNIAICLLLGTFIFLIGGVSTANGTFCKIIAIFTQFLFLSAFVWKLILGINVVRMIASLRYQNEDWMVKYRLATLGVGYGVPFFIVIVSGSIYWISYGGISDDVCWIENSSKAFLTFIIPIGIILAVNLIALFFIANALFRNYLNTRKTKVNESNEMLVFLQLVVSMGLTWLPSYFATVYLAAMYMWVLFFPLQGLMMFLFVVVINRENREKVSSFVLEKYSSLISKSTTNSDTRSHSKSKSTSHSKVTEHNQSLLSEHDKEKEIIKFPMVTITNQDEVTIPLKNPIS